MSGKKHTNGNGGSDALVTLVATFERRFDRLDALVATILDRMATTGDVEDVRQELADVTHRIEHRLGKIEKNGRKSGNGH